MNTKIVVAAFAFGVGVGIDVTRYFNRKKKASVANTEVAFWQTEYRGALSLLTEEQLRVHDEAHQLRVMTR